MFSTTTRHSRELALLVRQVSTTLRQSTPRIRRQTALVDSPTSYLPVDSNRLLFSRLSNRIVEVPSSVPAPKLDQFNSLIYRIKLASNSAHVNDIETIWQELKDEDLLVGINATVLEQISTVLVRSLEYSESSSSIPQNLEFLTEVALAAADHNYLSLLVEILLIHLRQDNSQIVLRFYERYAKSIEEEHEEAEDGDVDEIHAPQYTPAEVHILLSALTACAAREDFQRAVELCLASPTDFHYYSTNEFLARLSFDAVLQKRVQSYIPKLDIIRQLSRPLQLSKHISNLSRTESSRMLERLYNSMIQGISEKYVAADPSYTTPSTSVSVTQLVWTSFLSAFLKIKRNDLAETLWDDLLRFKVPTGPTLWSALIDGQVDQGAFLAAVSTWDTMLSRGVSPDTWTYRAYIEALFRARRRPEAMHAFKKFQEQVFPKSPQNLQVVIFNTVLRGLLRSGAAPEAAALLETMINRGPPPDVVSFNTFLAFYLQRGNLRGTATMFNKMTAANIQGDVVTFATILSTLVRTRRDDAIDTTLNLMRKQGLEPNAVTFTALIKQYTKNGGDEGNFVSAMKLLQKMEATPDMQPSAVTYTTLLAGLARYKLGPNRAIASVKFIVDRMKERGLELGTRTYTIVLKTVLALEGREALETALEYYREMISSNVRMDTTTWYILLVGLQARKEWNHCLQAISELVASGLEPDAALALNSGKFSIPKESLAKTKSLIPFKNPIAPASPEVFTDHWQDDEGHQLLKLLQALFPFSLSQMPVFLIVRASRRNIVHRV